jgi:hypothetical protein
MCKRWCVPIQGRPLSLVPRTIIPHPNPKIDGNHLVGVYPSRFVVVFLGYAFSRVFRSTLQGY